MNHKTLAIVLAVLLGGMALYYNLSVSDNATSSNASSGKSTVETTPKVK
jgi:hypothetical protein